MVRNVLRLVLAVNSVSKALNRVEKIPIGLCSVVSFQQQKDFVVKTGYFYSHIGLGMCEGVGEDSRHGFEHVDIRVGS